MPCDVRFGTTLAGRIHEDGRHANASPIRRWIQRRSHPGFVGINDEFIITAKFESRTTPSVL